MNRGLSSPPYSSLRIGFGLFPLKEQKLSLNSYILDVPLSLTNTGLTIICTLIYISRLEPNMDDNFIMKQGPNESLEDFEERFQLMIRGSNFAQFSKCSECDENQCHCVRLVFLIPAVYLLSQTESVWRRYRDLFAKPNRQKFDADCTCPYSPYGLMWQGRTDRTVMMWQLFIG
jgi:hypothetical protein